jgi:hypothetical protein
MRHASLALEPGIADAIVEADPVDPRAGACGVAVAFVDSPQRRLSFRDVGSGAVHCSDLRFDAPLLPLAIEPDVQSHRVMKRGEGARFGAPDTSDYPCEEKPQAHAPETGTHAARGQLRSFGKYRGKSLLYTAR